MGEVCPQCGRKFEHIGNHWQRSSDCDHPSLTDHQREITTGLLMGDGSLNRGGKNPRLQVGMISPNYLEHLDAEFDVLGTGVSLVLTAEESVRRMRESDFRPDAKVENYSDVYRWCSRSHPELHEFADWYETGEKVWPADIELTPTVLKHWYCGDGRWDNNGSNNYITIAMSNEVENTDKVDQMFENAGLPAPSNYDIQERPSGTAKCDAQFTVEQSHELWDYMGEPFPDFEYKWPREYR